ncbi:MAG: hypothetical protein ACJZ8O_03645 [Pirellulaceae bacterium]
MLQFTLATTGSWLTPAESTGFQSASKLNIQVFTDSNEAMSLPVHATCDVVMQYLSRHTTVQFATSELDVHLFKSQQQYLRFVRQFVSGDEPRRSTFIQSRDRQRIAVYVTQFAQQDLQHELCHALLHSTFRSSRVPLWIDEGLAECSELLQVTRSASGVVQVKYSPSSLLHPEYRKHVQLMASSNVLPAQCRLESLERRRNSLRMSWHEYAMSWAWSHFGMHGPVLIQREFKRYIQKLDSPLAMPALSSDMRARIPDIDSRFKAFFS